MRVQVMMNKYEIEMNIFEFSQSFRELSNAIYSSQLTVQLDKQTGVAQ